MLTIEIKEELDFDDIRDRVWGQAIDNLEVIIEHDKEEEFMSYIISCYEYDNERPTMTEINDLLAYDWEYLFDVLEIDENEENEEE